MSNELKSQLSKKTLSSSQSSNSLFSSSGTATYNEDDYFTAEDSEDNDGNSSSRLKYTKNQNTGKVLTKNLSSSSNLNGLNYKVRPNRYSAQSLRSKNSFLSIAEQDGPSQMASKESLLTETLVEDNINNNTLDDSNTFTEKQDTLNKVDFIGHHQFPSDVDSEMTLKFDIQRPILDSVLPKCCYLKYLSRSSVINWNRACIYPFYDDLKDKNIQFKRFQKGFDCSYVTTNILKNKSSSSNHEHLYNLKKDSDTSKECKKEEDNDTSMDSLKCRINLKFSSNITCYVTPLALTSLERVIKSFKSQKVNPNYLITNMQSKSEASFAQDSIIDVISKTQVSMNIPQILLCSLQCGLAEGNRFKIY